MKTVPADLDLEVVIAQLPLSSMPALIVAATKRISEEMTPTPPATAPTKEFVSVAEAAPLLGVSPKTLRRWTSSGLLSRGVHWHKAGRHIVIDWPAVREWIRSR